SPGETACLACLRVQLERHLAFLAPVLPLDRIGETVRAGHAAASQSQLALAASLATIEVLRASAPGQDCLTYNRLYTVDLDRLDASFQLVAKVPRCPVCGPTRDAPKMRIWS
ncbi:MAG TPA: TOMM precursor leader peptide-binding protein, partial [Kofleriaceae bacterium]